MEVLYLGSNKKKRPKKSSGKDLNKIEARFAERKQENEQFENKATKMLNVKGKLNNMEQAEMEY